MASTLLLKRRIKTAQNVSKTTRAMQMIAASKLKRAQNATLAARPYVDRLIEINKSLSNNTHDVDLSHPFLVENRNTDRKLVIIIVPDKGLCGGLITNLVRELLASSDKDFVFLTIGKKIERHVARLGREIVASFPFGTTLPAFNAVFPIANIVEEQFLTKKVRSIHILSTHFVSLFSQKPTFTTLLPLSLADITLEKTKENTLPAYALFEPDGYAILQSLLKHYLEMVLYQHLLESFLSEQAARMIAMQNATDNAKEIIEELTLLYNKERQSRITREILDISSTALYV